MSPAGSPTLYYRLAWLLLICGWLTIANSSLAAGNDSDADSDDAEQTSASSVEAEVLKDKPVAYWRFNGERSSALSNHRLIDAEGALDGTLQGELKFGGSGARPTHFPLFSSDNTAIEFPAGAGFVRVTDPGEKSLLDFDLGDSITIEAWINPGQLRGGGYGYILGKGRTQNPGFAQHNHNYALRVQGRGGGAALSFLFRSAKNDDYAGDWHRWTTGSAVTIDDGWHHVAVTYTFGKKDSICGYVDGEKLSGKWDMGSATDRAPVVDDDELWIGSSMGGQAGSTFVGLLDEVALYRTALSQERIRARYKYVGTMPPVELARVPEKELLVEVFEGIADRKSWNFRPPRYVESFPWKGFAFTALPKKYSDRGILIDRSNPYLFRATGWVSLPEGPHRLLLRCRNAGRLYLDDEQIAETKFHSINGNAHGRVFPVDLSLAPNIRPLHRGDTEALHEFEGDGRRHLLRLEMIVGGQSHRPELGETSVSIATPEGDFRIVSNLFDAQLTDEGWLALTAVQREELMWRNQDRRNASGTKETEYWRQRHELAREVLSKSPPPAVPAASDGLPATGPIDHFLNVRLVEASHEPTAPLDDLAFLRRLALDTVGTIPTLEQIDRYLQDGAKTRRAAAIERFLKEPGWADHWVGYWQDVLAENPNIINPTLNNTGPFRWWIHESFLDNKPIDRFATELVRMEGSQLYGGPAGFELATQNDAPMAAKAHILGQAFLGLEMKCARCHDAPYHDFKQSDLFSMAAMLSRSPQSVPGTSTIPGGASNSELVTVTLRPGEKVAPQWSFAELMPDELSSGVLRKPGDTRERLAALITSPQNQRFARVMVNRLWHRYLGRGLVEPVDDWEHAEPSHAQLLDYLAHQLATHDYDLKHVARLIFSSHVYGRQSSGAEAAGGADFLFAGPMPRRMTAEQVVDSMFAACEKPLDVGEVNIDIDNARNYTKSMNLGVATRAWHFSSLSNERDRPSLALPFAQPFVTVLETFGWRGARQDPLTVREPEPTILQPAIVANGVIGRRVTRLSDDSRFTALALEDIPLETLIERVSLQMLSRRATAEEQAMFSELLSDGYSERRRNAPITTRPRLPRNLVAWSNHLAPEANVIKTKLQAAVRRGDPPTQRLQEDWRLRMEDMLWAMMTTPEFLFVP